MDLPKNEYRELKLAIFFHDIGKMGVSRDILNKKERLTDEEFSQIKKHPLVGGELAKELGLSKEVVEAIIQHHERLDGGGYPHGLLGGDICYFARVITVLDVFDVMHRGRPYQSPKGKNEIIKELSINAGNRYDLGLVEMLIEIINVRI